MKPKAENGLSTRGHRYCLLFCICVHIYIGVYMYCEWCRGWPRSHLQPFSTLVFETITHQIQSSLIWPDWLANEVQGFMSSLLLGLKIYCWHLADMDAVKWTQFLMLVQQDLYWAMSPAWSITDWYWRVLCTEKQFLNSIEEWVSNWRLIIKLIIMNNNIP